jgi:hypothetical protein
MLPYISWCCDPEWCSVEKCKDVHLIDTYKQVENNFAIILNNQECFKWP